MDNLFNISLTLRSQDSFKSSGVLTLSIIGITAVVNCLVIDTNSFERQKLATWLSAMGHVCEQFSREGEAVDACNDNAPDLVVISSNSSVENVLQQISRGPSRPVILVYSDKAELDRVSHSIVNGASDVLMKPFDRELLRFKLQQNGIACAS